MCFFLLSNILNFVFINERPLLNPGCSQACGSSLSKLPQRYNLQKEVWRGNGLLVFWKSAVWQNFHQWYAKFLLKQIIPHFISGFSFCTFAFLTLVIVLFIKFRTNLHVFQWKKIHMMLLGFYLCCTKPVGTSSAHTTKMRRCFCIDSALAASHGVTWK